jgi:hypothetical protein
MSKAHRQILAAASPVFEAMLYPNYDIPGEKGPVSVPVEITVTGCEPKGFLGLLKAVYSDKVSVDSSNSMIDTCAYIHSFIHSWYCWAHH